eukprot:g1938.t1
MKSSKKNRSRKALPKMLLKAREQRKDAENDAQLLANRIALLKAEEQKAWKKIQQTQKRAEKIVESRVNVQMKQQEMKTQQENHRGEILKRMAAKKKAEMQMLKKREEELMRKRELVQEMRREKEESKAMKDRLNRKVLRDRRKNTQKIKEQQQLARERIDEERSIKQRIEKNHYKEKCIEEERLIKSLESDLKGLVAKEKEMIDRLQNIQQFQAAAFEELENALTGKGSKIEE